MLHPIGDQSLFPLPVQNFQKTRREWVEDPVGFLVAWCSLRHTTQKRHACHTQPFRQLASVAKILVKLARNRWVGMERLPVHSKGADRQFSARQGRFELLQRC